MRACVCVSGSNAFVAFKCRCDVLCLVLPFRAVALGAPHKFVCRGAVRSCAACACCALVAAPVLLLYLLIHREFHIVWVKICVIVGQTLCCYCVGKICLHVVCMSWA